jgi:hypothetical protein
MTPTAAGRHCAACQKTVVDFTQKTDAEILAHLTQAAGRTCGRFRAGQLARPLQPAPAEPNRWRAWLGALLAVGSLGQLLAPKAAAQTAVRGTAGPVPAAVAPAQEPASPTGSPAAGSRATQPAATPRPGSSRIVRGTVRDEVTHDPLPGVTVLLKGTTLGTSTDVDGAFSLTIPADAPTVQLGFHYIGYNSVEQPVTIADNTPLAVVLNTDVVVLGGDVVITRLYKPWPWHPRRLYYWSKAQLGRALGR